MVTASVSASAAGRRPSAWTVFAAFACLYALSLGGGFGSSDGEVMFKTAAALIERGDFALAADAGLPQIIPGGNPSGSTSETFTTYYSKYDPGFPLLAAPFYALGDWIGARHHGYRTQLAAIAVLLLPALAAAGSVTLVYGLAREMAGSRRGVIVALAAGLATSLWPYARLLFAESVLALALTGTVAGIWWGRARPVGWLALAGAIFGVGVITRAAVGGYALPLAFLIVSVRREVGRETVRDGGWRVDIARLAAFGVGVLPAIALLAWHNTLRVGDPLAFGYTGEGFSSPVWRGALGLLISPGKGSLWYAPPLILGVILWPRWWRHAPALAGFTALAWIVALVFYGGWWAWDGGWCWGPRFVVPLMPLSCLPLALLPDRARWRWLAGALLVVGSAIQVAGVWGDVTPLYARVANAYAGDTSRVSWHPADAPLIHAAQQVARGEVAPRALFRLADTRLSVTWSVGVPLALVAGLTISAGRIAWACRRERVNAFAR